MKIRTVKNEHGFSQMKTLCCEGRSRCLLCPPFSVLLPGEPYFVKALLVETVTPALHELSWELVFAEHSNFLAILAFFNGFNHFVKAALITFVLSMPQERKC